MKTSYAVSMLVLALACLGPAGPACAQVDAAAILKTTGTTSGLIVHADVTDGRLTADLAAGGDFLVHGLAATDVIATAARRHLAERGVHGRASVEVAGLKRLPYVSNMVNLLVLSDWPAAEARGLTKGEVMRVLEPHGAAWLGAKNADPMVLRKERPEGVDDWTHWLHSPECNNVSGDRVTGPAERIQWIDGPVWLEGANLSELFANGRSFNIVQLYRSRKEGARITARDAYNGLVLWRRHIDTARKTYDQRAVVAVGDRVYAVVDMTGPLAALDAATGEVVRTYDVGFTPKCVFYHDGQLILAAEKEIVSVNADTGAVDWRRPAPEGAPFVLEATNTMKYAVSKKPYMVAGDGRAFVFIKDAEKPPWSVVAIDLATGEERWRKKQGGELVAHYKGALVFYDLQVGPVNGANGKGVHTVFSAADGHVLWTRAHLRRSNHPDEPCYAQGLVWITDNTRGSLCLVGFDVTTGEEKRRFDRGTWGHCARLITTDNFLIGKMTELISLETGKHFGFGFYKNGCRVGQLPANGHLYTFPISCSCIAYVRGYVAFTPPGENVPEAPVNDVRLEKGPAYGPAAGVADKPTDWPTYRHDNRRSGVTPTALPANLKVLWSTSVNDGKASFYGKTITPPTIAGGMVFVGTPDAHGVVALDAATGDVRWRYLLDGRVEAPPTAHAGRVYFGSSDGWAYCLRASDGALAWRYRGAPYVERLAVRGRLESPWPVPCVMVEGDRVVFAAGRHSKSPDGLYVYAAQADTGEILWTTSVDNKNPETWYDNHVNDLLLSDGKSAFMVQLMFDLATGEKSRTYFKKKTFYEGRLYKHDYLLSGQGRDTSAVFPFGFLYDRKEDVTRERYESTYWHYRGLSGFTLAFTDDRVFGVTTNRQLRTFHELFAAKPERTREPLKEPPVWTVKVPVDSVQALLVAGDTLWTGGAAKDGGGALTRYSAADGGQQGEIALDDVPVFDGLAVAGGRLYVSTLAGKVICLGAK